MFCLVTKYYFFLWTNIVGIRLSESKNNDWLLVYFGWFILWIVCTPKALQTQSNFLLFFLVSYFWHFLTHKLKKHLQFTNNNYFKSMCMNLYSTVVGGWLKTKCILTKNNSMFLILFFWKNNFFLAFQKNERKCEFDQFVYFARCILYVMVSHTDELPKFCWCSLKSLSIIKGNLCGNWCYICFQPTSTKSTTALNTQQKTLMYVFAHSTP